ncbi:MAG: hypothetical protein IKT74_00860 [Bacteroidales bacterium]|nr:hypothetical protein [Bacteroidales bacterium]
MAFSILANAQERVYVSTDKECYLSGEDIWVSVFCSDGSSGEKGSLSKVAYLEFHNREGMVSTVKVALKQGRGCARYQIPFSFPTGNYSIVSYTKCYGGESVGEFNGKIISVFNTLSGSRVKEGVEVVAGNELVKAAVQDSAESKDVRIEIGKEDVNGVPVSISNLSGNELSYGVSVYHMDDLNRVIEESRYNKTTLLNRTGDFKTTGEVDYAGEVIKAKITPKGDGAQSVENLLVYMSAMGNTDDIYTSSTNKDGEVVYYTNNIYGNRDLVFEVAGDTSMAFNVEIVNKEYRHKSVQIPVLKISSAMEKALVQRGMGMQIVKRFEADTLFNLMDKRETSFIGVVNPLVYNLDNYTRFPVMEEVIREYVKELRVRKDKDETVLKILWGTKEKALVMLDGVPVLNHSAVVEMDPLNIKQIIVYPRSYILNTIVYDGIVKFNTYKGDMAGLKLGKNVSIESYRGVQYPLAFLGDNLIGKSNYPNFNNTIYWNPIVNVNKGETFNFNCVKPQYKGKFKIVVEGVDSKGKQVYSSVVFEID